MWQATIGELNQRVVIERPVTTQNDFGEQVITWTHLATVWANVRALPQREGLVDDQVVSVVATKFTIRYRSTVTAKMRILFNGRIYMIETVADVEAKRRFLEIRAVERSEGL